MKEVIRQYTNGTTFVYTNFFMMLVGIGKQISECELREQLTSEEEYNFMTSEKKVYTKPILAIKDYFTGIKVSEIKQFKDADPDGFQAVGMACVEFLHGTGDGVYGKY